MQGAYIIKCYTFEIIQIFKCGTLRDNLLSLLKQKKGMKIFSFKILDAIS